MLRLIRFVKECFYEVRHKMSWPSYQELQTLMFWFFVGTIIWSLFLFGVNEIGKKLQETVYEWLNKKN